MIFSTHEHFDNAAIANEHIDVRPLAAAMGAEIAGVDCANVSDAAFAEIEAALFRHKMIYFRGQQRMTHGDQSAFSRRFGPFAFNAFRHLYNEERPHQALQGAPPAARYRPSLRRYPDALPPLEYPGHFTVKRVTDGGEIFFKKRLLFLAKALHQHHVGLEEVADGVWSIHFGRIRLGHVDERDRIVRP